MEEHITGTGVLRLKKLVVGVGVYLPPRSKTAKISHMGFLEAIGQLHGLSNRRRDCRNKTVQRKH